MKNKTPAEVLDFDGEWALEEGETIETSVWTVSGTGLVIDSSTFSGNVVKVWLSAGTSGTKYLVLNTITTSEGRTLQDGFHMAVKTAA